MSEYINNNTKKQELLKDILKGIHNGQSMDTVRENFARLVKIADAGEIALAEQMLITEGTPASEIQNLCDLHVAAVRDSLNEQQPPDTIPGHPVYTLRAENETLAVILTKLHESVDNYLTQPNPETRNKVIDLVSSVKNFEKHYLRKENLLFPALERYGFTGPSQVMWGIQDQIRIGIKNLGALFSGSSTTPADQAIIQAAMSAVEGPMREMIYKEEKILFPAALEYLDEDDWYAIRRQEAEIGYFMVQPGGQWKPASQIILEEESRAVQPQAPQAVSPGDLIGLQIGALSAEQVNLLLTNLPVDVTFVDENDEVRFFSQTKDRIFARSESIIGRKVQHCHPPKSLKKVQKILDDFRAGNLDIAEFWIQMNAHFIHIRYFAMRDVDGKYRGTLEVSQDVTGIRALEGERRLLDD
jgi:DUF438 domain-containing protein